MLSGMYGSNPELLLDRVGAGVAEVIWQQLCLLLLQAYDN